MTGWAQDSVTISTKEVTALWRGIARLANGTGPGELYGQLTLMHSAPTKTTQRWPQ